MPVGTAYEIVPYHARFRDCLLRMRAELHSIDPRWNEAHHRWQQEENPSFDGHLVQLALHEGRPVAMRMLQAAEWEAGSPPSRFRAPTFVGTYIDPGHRSRGLFARLTGAAEAELADRNIGWVLNTSPAAVTLVASLAEGWKCLGSLAAATRTVSIRGPGLGQRVRRNAARLAGSLRPAPRGVRFSGDPLPRQMADVARAGRDGRIRRRRDEAFFRWRFRDPSSRYRFVYVERSGSLAGFAALHRSSGAGAGAFCIADWGRTPDLPWRELLGAVVGYAERMQQDLVTWLGTFPDAARTLLLELGFEPDAPPGAFARERPTVLVRRIGDADASAWSIEGRRADDAREWDLRMTDSDLF